MDRRARRLVRAVRLLDRRRPEKHNHAGLLILNEAETRLFTREIASTSGGDHNGDLTIYNIDTQ